MFDLSENSTSSKPKKRKQKQTPRATVVTRALVPVKHEKTILHGEIVRPGKDEMNLIEYPFAVLSQKESKNTVIDLHWNATHPLSGKIVPASWMVTGTTAFGLPTTTDERVCRAEEKERTHWCYSNSRASRVLPRRSCIFRALRFD